jgi:hypothetical protein
LFNLTSNLGSTIVAIGLGALATRVAIGYNYDGIEVLISILVFTIGFALSSLVVMLKNVRLAIPPKCVGASTNIIVGIGVAPLVSLKPFVVP